MYIVLYKKPCSSRSKIEHSSWTNIDTDSESENEVDLKLKSKKTFWMKTFYNNGKHTFCNL